MYRLYCKTFMILNQLWSNKKLDAIDIFDLVILILLIQSQEKGRTASTDSAADTQCGRSHTLVLHGFLQILNSFGSCFYQCHIHTSFPQELLTAEFIPSYVWNTGSIIPVGVLYHPHYGEFKRSRTSFHKYKDSLILPFHFVLKVKGYWYLRRTRQGEERDYLFWFKRRRHDCGYTPVIHGYPFY